MFDERQAKITVEVDVNATSGWSVAWLCIDGQRTYVSVACGGNVANVVKGVRENLKVNPTVKAFTDVV